MMQCKHQFIKISELRRSFDNALRASYGIQVGCPHCGEIRELFENGNLRVSVEGNPEYWSKK